MGSPCLWVGGTPVISFMHCEHHKTEFMPPFGLKGYPRVPPYNSHICAHYPVGSRCISTPIIPAQMEWQRDNLYTDDPQVGDILRLFAIPCDHILETVRFDVNDFDAGLAGATGILTAERVTINAQGNFDWTEISDITDAMTAHGVTSIPLDVPGTFFASLIKERPASSGYMAGLYSAPIIDPTTYDRSIPALMIGLKILSLPTDPEVKLYQALNDFYFAGHVKYFESIGNL